MYVYVYVCMYNNNENAAILKIIKISKNSYGRFTIYYPKFLSSPLIQRKMQRNFTPAFQRLERFKAHGQIYKETLRALEPLVLSIEQKCLPVKEV